MSVADDYMRAVRRGDEPSVARLRAELVAQGYEREAIRDLWEVWGMSADEHNARLRGGAERQLVALDLRQAASAPLEAP